MRYIIKKTILKNALKIVKHSKKHVLFMNYSKGKVHEHRQDIMINKYLKKR